MGTIADIEREEKKARASVTDAAKRGDMSSARVSTHAAWVLCVLFV